MFRIGNGVSAGRNQSWWAGKTIDRSMTPEDLKIMQGRLAAKGVPQDPDLEILRKRQKLQELHDKYFAHRACEESRGAQVPVHGRASSGSSCASTRGHTPSRPATPERDLRKRADAPQDILPRPQCSSGTTQSRPYPARAVKVIMESARQMKASQTRAGAEKPEDESPGSGQQSVTAGRDRQQFTGLVQKRTERRNLAERKPEGQGCVKSSHEQSTAQELNAHADSRHAIGSPVQVKMSRDGKVEITRQQIADPSRSIPEERFYSLWQACGGPALCREHRIFRERKWRADFAHLQSQTIIEIDGGVWKPGGHNMAGHVRDCERDLECVLNGWRVIRLVPSMITVENIERMIVFVKGNKV